MPSKSESTQAAVAFHSARRRCANTCLQAEHPALRLIDTAFGKSYRTDQMSAADTNDRLISDGREESEEDVTHKPPQSGAGASEAKVGGKKMENPAAIPSAGGERLGEKHWGESKIVPADPGAIKIEAGQPDGTLTFELLAVTFPACYGIEVRFVDVPVDLTAANTAKNTGGVSHHNEKEGALHKIKDKLNLGKKE